MGLSSAWERCVFGFMVDNVTASLAKGYSILRVTVLSATVPIAQKLLGFHQCCYHDLSRWSYRPDCDGCISSQRVRKSRR